MVPNAIDEDGRPFQVVHKSIIDEKSDLRLDLLSSNMDFFDLNNQSVQTPLQIHTSQIDIEQGNHNEASREVNWKEFWGKTIFQML